MLAKPVSPEVNSCIISSYVQPEKSREDLWTQKTTLPDSQQDQKSLFSPDVILASTAVATGRITNGTDGNLLHHQRLIAEGIRGSPRFNTAANSHKGDSPPPPPPLPENKESTEDQKLDKHVAELLEDKDTPTREQPIRDSPPIPGAVLQDVA